MNNSSPEEQRLLLEMFINWDSRHYQPEAKSDELFLGCAFEYALNNASGSYIQVPERMVDQVQKYVDALRAVEDKAVA